MTSILNKLDWHELRQKEIILSKGIEKKIIQKESILLRVVHIRHIAFHINIKLTDIFPLNCFK